VKAELALALAGGALLAAPQLADTVVPIPPLPPASAHNDAWNAAWGKVLARGLTLQLPRVRAVNLQQLAMEQAQALGSPDDPAHAKESAWLTAWMDAWAAGYAANNGAFGVFEGGGERFGGEGLFRGISYDGLKDMLDGNPFTTDQYGGDQPLSPVGQGLQDVILRWRDSVAVAVGMMRPQSTIARSRAAVLSLAQAMDGAESPAGFLPMVTHDALSLVWKLLGFGLDALLTDALPIALAAGGAYLAWRHYR